MSQLSLAISYQYDITSVWYISISIWYQICFTFVICDFDDTLLLLVCLSLSLSVFCFLYVFLSLSVSFFIFLPVSASHYFILLQFSIDRFFAIWVSILQPFRFAIFLINYLTALASTWLHQSRLSPGQLFLACAEVTGHRPALFTLSVL